MSRRRKVGMARGMNIFNAVQVPNPPTTTFNLSHDLKLSLQMGKLVPILTQEVLPGDKFNIGTENFLRMAPLISPVMHRVDVNTHFFFVPNRIIFPQWEDFITGKEDIEWPYVSVAEDGALPNSLGDYLGYAEPGADGDGLKQSALPIAAYIKIFDEYFRSQQLQPENFMEVTPGDNTANYAGLIGGAPFYRGWMHDYFTGSLPTAQEGNPVTLPLTTDDRIPVQVSADTNAVTIRRASDDLPVGAGNVTSVGSSAANARVGADPVFFDPNGSLEVDINEEAVTINTLRRAFRLQEYLERVMRAGQRYFEWVRSMFGVTPSDARLQRPEYIGGSSQRMVISEVLSTANTEVDTSETPVGSMAGHGISVGGGNKDTYYAEEHGWIIGIISVMPETAYQQGLHRSFSREDYLDYANPIFANIGEQEVKVKEIYASAAPVIQESTFGYVPRYADYRFNNSRVAGEFKTTLAYWHLGRIFSSPPALNGNFIVCNPSTRIFAVENNQHIYAQIFINMYAKRRLPRWGTPTI